MKLKYKSWKDISVNVYDKLQERVKAVHLTGDETLDGISQNIALISVLCETDEDTIANLGVDKFGKLVREIEFLKDMPKVEIKTDYELNGKKYEVWLDIQNMNMAQYIDFQTFYKESEKHTKELIACFLLPKGKKYCDGYQIAEVIDDIGNYLSIVDARSIMFFFTLAFRSLTKAMLNYSTKKMKKAMKNEKDREKVNKIKIAIQKMEEAMNLVENGDGLII